MSLIGGAAEVFRLSLRRNPFNLKELFLIMLIEEADVFLLKREEVTPEEFEIITKQLKTKQIPVKMRRGRVSYNLGILTSVKVGREGLFGSLVFNPGIKLRTEGEGEGIKSVFVEWVSGQ